MLSLVPKPLPPHVTAVPPGVTDPLDIHAGCTYGLLNAYICMRMNGTDHYASIGAETRYWFEYWLAGGYLWSLIENFRHGACVEVAVYGLHIADAALNVSCMNRVVLGQLLPEKDLIELGHVIDHLQAVVRRIDAAEALAELRAAARPSSTTVLALTEPNAPTHAPDFCWVKCRLGQFMFTGGQRQIVAALWEDWSVGGLGLSHDHLRDQGKLPVDAAIRHVFKNNSAWGKLIVPTELKDVLRLALPAPAQKNL